ncbi:MAG: gamma-glutamyl-gamma-aminobutyrate hydrolase family protein [Acetobacteraceae bacterium]|nr:gamma-glutamyl-gamma-aminobutyrate hydrolase family protein [Acetobacteraceae bacterium]
MTPVVGVTCTFRQGDGHLLGAGYVSALEAAGAAPLLLPVAEPALLEAALGRLDGLVLSGGGDIDPAHFGQPPRAEVCFPNPRRDEAELRLARLALERGLPVLAICRGVQVLNVAAGGDLIQDIPLLVPGAVRHLFKPEESGGGHWVRIDPRSRLARLAGGERAWVNSFHHQAVDRPGRGLRAVAWAEDGVIEALEPEGEAPVMGVQWHPERMFERDPLAAGLFRALVEAASARAGRAGGLRPGGAGGRG